MKGYWKVSMAAIGVRADRLKLITPYQKKKFWIEMSQNGYRKREPNSPPPEHPTTLRSMVAFHRRKLGYSAADMASMLCLTVPDFERMYGVEAFGDQERPKPQLRLVK